MHLTSVKFKDGREISGVLWIWRPEEGWFELAGMEDRDINTLLGIPKDIPVHDDEGGPYRIFLREIIEAKEYGVMVRHGVIEDVDLLERAREEGWKE